MPYYQLATPTPAPAEVAAMLPASGGMRADKLEVRFMCIKSCKKIEFHSAYIAIKFMFD